MKTFATNEGSIAIKDSKSFSNLFAILHNKSPCFLNL